MDDKRLLLAFGYLMVLLMIGLFAHQITGPGKLIGFGPNQVAETMEGYQAPGAMSVVDGEERVHVFGTDGLGRDVASRMVHGVSIALLVGFFSSMISLLIAMILGGLSGYYGNTRFKLNWLQLILIPILLLLAHFYSQTYAYQRNDVSELDFSVYKYVISMGLGLLGTTTLAHFLSKLDLERFALPLDSFVVKAIEVFASLPKLFFFLAIFAVITRPSLITVIIVIGAVRWSRLTRLIRAEILSVRQENYVLNAEMSGFSGYRVFSRHIFPNIYRSVLVLTAFNIGSAILIESALSFLEIGLPIEQVSLGRMLSDARNYLPAWWLAVGPGMLIFSLILCFNIIGDRLSHVFDAKR